MEAKQNRIAVFLIWCLIAIPAVEFFVSFFVYTVNIPVNDDYRAILKFLNDYLDLSSFKEKVRLIFSQHNEHRIVYDRVWILLDYYITGKMNFNFLCAIGNASLIGIFYVFYLKFKELHLKWIYLFPVSVLVFNIAFWENTTFAMAAISNISVFLFSLLSIYFLTRPSGSKQNILFSFLFMVMAVFTQGGGVFLIPVSLFILIYRRLYKFAGIYFLCSVIVFSAFFYGYEKVDYHPDALKTFVDFKVRALLFAFSFLGNAVNYFLIYTNDQSESISLSGITGFALFLVFLYSIKTKYYQKNLFVFSIMLLMVIIAFITGVNRCQMGLETSGASRYRINGAIFLIAVYYWFIETVETKRKIWLILPLALLYFVCISMSHYEYLSFRKRASLTGALFYRNGDHTRLNGFEQDEYKKILLKSAANKTYELPSAPQLEKHFPFSRPVVLNSFPESQAEVRHSVNTVARLKDSYLIDGWAFLEGLPAKDQKVYIGLQADSSEVIFYNSKQEPRYDLNPYFHKYNLRDAGYISRIKFDNLKPGDHRIFIKIVNGNETRTIETDKRLTN